MLTDLSAMEGRTILGIEISDFEDYIRFKTNDGDLVYFADGDCCSESWFSDIYGLDSLLGQVVVSAQETLMPKTDCEDGRCRQDYDAAYGFTLKTQKGTTDFVYRNSSNGYYGGHLTGPLSEDGVMCVSNFRKFRSITGNDWSAQ